MNAGPAPSALARRFGDLDPVVVDVAEAYANGRTVPAAPSSLRLWALSKALGGPVVDVLAEDYALIREFECYAAAEQAAEKRRADEQRQKARARRGRR